MNDRGNLYRSRNSGCPCGSPIRDRFIKDTTQNPPRLKKIGTTDQQALIQSYADECDINRIIARYEAGDSSVLARVQGLYTDTTVYPDNAVAALNLSNKVKQMWESLPLEEQAKFGTQEAFVDAVVNSLGNPILPNVEASAPSEGDSSEGGTAQ